MPPVEQRLRREGYDLTNFDWYAGSGSTGESGNDGGSDLVEVAERMSGCEIYWSRANRADEDSDGGRTNLQIAAQDTASGNGGTSARTKAIFDTRDRGESRQAFLGIMGEGDGGTWITSQTVEGLEILVMDDIRLWYDRLWVNDRGFDRKGDFVYGNQRGVPYKMCRVEVPGPLEWTLGREWRTEQLYSEKMFAIGVTPGQRFGPTRVSYARLAPSVKLMGNPNSESRTPLK